MKRFLCLLVLSALLLTACHGTYAPKGQLTAASAPVQLPETLDETRKIELNFWAKNDTNKTQTEIYNKAASDFQKLYPNITVKMRLYTDYNRIYNDVITNLATDTTPDVCITYPDHIATYLTGADTVIPLDSLIADPRYGLGGSELKFDSPTKEEIIPQFLKECTLGGTVYAMPFMRSTEACYVNVTLLEKLGYELPDVLTWDFVWEASEAAARKNADGTYALNGQKVMIPFIYKSTDNMMITMLHQLDAGYSTDAGEILLFQEQTGQILKTVAEHTKSGAFSTFQISSYPANFLNAGQCLFAVDSSAGATWMGCDAPLLDISEETLARFETAVRPIPQYDSYNISMISQGPSLCLFRKADPQQMLAAWLFTQYLLSNEVQNAYAQTEGYVPVTAKAQQSEAYQSYLSQAGVDNERHYSVKIAASQLLLNHSEDTFVTPVFNGSTSLRNAAGQLIEGVCKGVRRKQTIDDAFIEKLYADTASLYRLDQIQVAQDEAFGPLPATAQYLLGTLAAAWIGIGVYWFFQKKSRK